MPDGGRGHRLSRAHLPEEERRLRSELAQLITGYGWVRGNLSIREKVCGKPSCRCSRGERHEAAYLVASEEGKLEQLFIPKTLLQTTEEWVGNYHRIRELLEVVSQLQRDKLERREP
jgi:hypothetical protein